MQIATHSRRIVQGLVLAVALGAGAAMAQSEPTLDQIYAKAHAGQLDEAQTMVQQVLIGHPNSAKAHFVRAELFARQGDLVHAREALAQADKLAPGLPFAKPEAVSALRSQLAGGRTVAAGQGQGQSIHRAAPSQSADTASGGGWVVPLALGAIVLVAGFLLFRRNAPQAMPPQGYGAPGSGLNGPQTFGMGSGVQPPGYPPQPGGYAQPTGTGLGGRIMGGVATGLAVGAGVMAAEAIARNLGGSHNAPSAGSLDNASHNDYQPIADTNRDMGGNDFGINDAGSWDDGGGMDLGGSDWDN